jgi:hypothetical protein
MAGHRGPGALIRRGSLADPDIVKCASPAARQSPAQVARRLCPPAAPAATGLLARHAARPGLTHEPAPVDVAGPVPRRTAGLPARLPGHGRCAQHLDAGDAMRLRRFGTTIAPGSGDAWYGRPATAGHPGAIGLPPARRSLPVPGLHQPVCRGGWRRPDRADVQPPPVPPAGAPPGSAVLPEMVRLPPGAWVISTRRAWVLGETGMVRCRTPSA